MNRDLPFHPYFFIPKASATEEILKVLRAIDPFTKAIDTDLLYGGTPITKIEMSSPNSTYQAGQQMLAYGVSTFEGDVPFPRRVMIDLGLSVEIPDKKLYFDIEVDPTHGFPKPEEAKARILSIAGCDQTGKFWCFSDDDEKVTIKKFLELTENYLVISGWNSAKFDYPYLRNRCKALGIYFDWFNVVHVDMMPVYRLLSKRRKPVDYRLGTVAEHELGKSKAADEDGEMRISKLMELFNTNRTMLEIYNIEDAKLLHELDEKYNIIGIIFSIASITHTTVPALINADTATSGVNHSTAVDGLVLYLAYRRRPRLIFPTRIFSEDYEKQTFEGSIVFDMVAGVHRDVATLDFSSLYPSLIKTFNIGTETYKKDGSGDITAVIGSFVSEPKSILAEAVDYMGKKRNEYKKLRDLAIPNSEEYHIRAGQQFAVKSILLSFYGVIGYQSSRYFNLDIASNVTLLGQAFTKKAKELAEKSGFIVLAGDTDSIFVKSRTEFKRGGIVEESQKLADEITADLKVWAKEKFNVKNFQISLEIDRVYASWYAPGPKKQYAGIMIYQGGQACCDLYVRGMAVRRKDTPIAVAEFQTTLLKLVLSEKSRSEIADFARVTKNKLLKGEFDGKLLIHKGLSRDIDSYLVDSPHLRAAKKLRAAGADVKRGDKVSYMRVGPKKDDVIAVQNKKQPHVTQQGYEYIWKTQFEPVLESFGLPSCMVKRLEEF